MSVSPDARWRARNYPLSNYVAQQSTHKRCPECRLKIRGANHENGQSHKERSK